VRELRPPVDHGLPADETPDIGVEAPELLLDLQEAAGVVDCGRDLEPVADDARVGQEPGDLPFVEPGHPRGVEAGEGAAEILAFLKDGQPGQPGLESLEQEMLEDPAVVMDGDPPFHIVIMVVDIGP
jgi:hypothetical protein